MKEIFNEAILINEIEELTSCHINDISTLLNDGSIISKEYEHYKKSLPKPSFNIFELISDTYYKENFHSDIIACFLDKDEKHNAGNKYLIEFIKLLQLHKSSGINITDFSNAKVVTEEGKIDILIKDYSSKKAIIIENKINNAVDMIRQLPRYYEAVKGDDFEVVAIVYLSLNGNKYPSTEGWTSDEQKLIKSELICLAAFNSSEKNLVNGWIKQCILLTSDINVLSTLKQYSHLIQTLRGDVMNEEILKKFYNLVVENNKYDTALSIKSMVEELPRYLARKIVEKYENNSYPFQRVIPYEEYVALIDEFKINKANLAIDIACFHNKYSFQFHDRNRANQQAYKALEYLRLKEKFSYNGDCFVVIFKFPEEEEKLYQFIGEFKDKLKTLPSDLFE